MSAVMGSPVSITRESTNQKFSVQVNGPLKSVDVTEQYIRHRLGLHSTVGVKKIYMESLTPDKTRTLMDYSESASGKIWCLEGGRSFYVHCGHDAFTARSVEEKGKSSMEVIDVSSPGEDTDVKKSFREATVVISGPIADSSEAQLTDSEAFPEFRLSAMDSALNLNGASELCKFMKRRIANNDLDHRRVRCLPRSYNGDIVFELPPADAGRQKGAGLRDMDRDNDCHWWTRMMKTSANLRPKNRYQVNKATCTGVLECINLRCPYALKKGCRNQSSWKGRPNVSNPFKVGEIVPDSGLVCGHCSQRPMCTGACDAQMFYVYPNTDVDDMVLKHSSRLAVHMGFHNHPPREVFGRESIRRATELIDKHVSVDSFATPSRVRNFAARDLLRELHPDATMDLSEEEKQEIFDSLGVLGSQSKYTALLRSVRILKEPKSEFEMLMHIQRHSLFPCIQRYRLPGQGSKSDRAFILKMTEKGDGSGVDILRRMQKGGPLEGTWVMFDVMHRINTGWLTFSAHVYDHNYRGLCTIFTCELMSEDAESQETAWREMISVAKEKGLTSIEIHGFMADNAQAGWIAVRNVFFDGLPNPGRERSDCFHFKKSLRQHTLDCILPQKHEEHYELWGRLVQAKSYVLAYHIGEEIRAWWRKGNSVSGKLKELEAWLAWWIIRWRLWGNYIRLTCTGLEGALMPNCTGSESMHHSMRASLSKKMVSLTEACEADSNRRALQIGAYDCYEKGLHRGTGPTVWELAFRSANSVGTTKSFIDASNVLFANSPMSDLYRTEPLNGDLRTKSVKRKISPATPSIGPQDSHRPDRILVTSPNTRGFARKNLSFCDEEGKVDEKYSQTQAVGCRSEGESSKQPPVIHISENSSSSDDTRIIDPPQRPATRSQTVPDPVHQIPTVPQIPRPNPACTCGERNVPYNCWQFKRCTPKGAGPVCNGTLLRSARDECRNRIRSVGYESRAGVIGIAVHGTRVLDGIPRPAWIWFCPNNICLRSRLRRFVGALPPIPDSIPMSSGTNASPEELEFLLAQGLRVEGWTRQPSTIGPTAVDLAIDVNHFPERVSLQNPTLRLMSRNGKQCRQRQLDSAEFLKKKRSATVEVMRKVDEVTVIHGNGWGKQICIATHENDPRLAKRYWVQICVFPCCSCPDFFKRHTTNKSYMPCKHLLWTFRNTFRLDLGSSLIVKQPVLTISEVMELIGRQVVI